MEDFTIELAGVPVNVTCRFSRNRDFFAGYFSDLEPRFKIAPDQDDLERMQAEFERMDEVEGIPKHRRSDSFLENNAIHALIAEGMVEYNVLLMHGSALCMDGQAVIFTAKSGTGKSTHSRLWRELYGDRVWMINDDKPMLRIEEDNVLVYGTPWDGKHHLSRNTCVPLKAVVKLERSADNSIRRISKADAFPVLMRQALGSRNPAKMAQIMKLENMVLNAVDFYRLGCNMELDAARVACEGIFTLKVH